MSKHYAAAVVSWPLLLPASYFPRLASSTGAFCTLWYQMLCFMPLHHCGPPLGCLLQPCRCPGCRQHLLAASLTACVTFFMVPSANIDSFPDARADWATLPSQASYCQMS